jgi:hypothetical protein
MATEAQIAANRLNAQKSTGPRTPEGKEKVSQNAVTHGLLARAAVLHGEDWEEFTCFREDMLRRHPHPAATKRGTPSFDGTWEDSAGSRHASPFTRGDFIFETDQSCETNPIFVEAVRGTHPTWSHEAAGDGTPAEQSCETNPIPSDLKEDQVLCGK